MSSTGEGSLGHAVEVRGLAHVGGLGVPREGVALRGGQRLPPLVAGEDVGVVVGEHVLADRPGDGLLDLGRRGPDVAQEHVVAVGVLPERVGLEVEVHRPGERVRDHQRRRGEVVHLHVRVDPALEVAVAGQHRDDREVVLLHRGRDLVDDRPGVADAGGAAVADQVVAELLQVRRQAGLVVVVGDHLAAGGERGLHPRLALQALLDRLLRQQPRPDHHRRVRGVGAAGDRGDHHRAVVDLDLLRRRARP